MSGDKVFRPMLAAPATVSDVRYPAYGQAKVDGLRCLAMDGRPMSRKMKVLPNRHLQRIFAEHGSILEGLDGEIVVGDPCAPDCYRKTSSAIMSEDGEPDFRFLTFDLWNMPGIPYTLRQTTLTQRMLDQSNLLFTEHLDHLPLPDLEALDSFEAELLEQGYEGVMVRSPDGVYKQNRSTIREGGLLKIKRFEDAEGVVIGFEEEVENRNEKVTNELGYSKRSTHKANKVGKDTLGKLLLRGLNGRFMGVEFAVGLAISAAECAKLWEERDTLIGRISTYRFFPIGCKDKPRFPQHHGFRDVRDFDSAS